MENGNGGGGKYVCLGNLRGQFRVLLEVHHLRYRGTRFCGFDHENGVTEITSMYLGDVYVEQNRSNTSKCRGYRGEQLQCGWRREVGEEVKGNSRIPLVKYLVRQWDGKVNGAFRYLYVYMNLYYILWIFIYLKRKKMNQIFMWMKIHFYQMCSNKCNK